MQDAAATSCAGAQAGEEAVEKREDFAFGSSFSSPGSSGGLCATMVDACWDCGRSGRAMGERGHLAALVGRVLRLRNVPGFKMCKKGFTHV